MGLSPMGSGIARGAQRGAAPCATAGSAYAPPEQILLKNVSILSCSFFLSIHSYPFIYIDGHES